MNAESEIKGKLKGIPLTTFLQLCENDQKTCGLEVASGDKCGTIVLWRGSVFSAATADKQAEDAVIEMFAWRNPQIEINSFDAAGRKLVKQTLMQMMTVYLEQSQENRITKEHLEQYREKLKQAKYQKRLAGRM